MSVVSGYLSSVILKISFGDPSEFELLSESQSTSESGLMTKPSCFHLFGLSRVSLLDGISARFFLRSSSCIFRMSPSVLEIHIK